MEDDDNKISEIEDMWGNNLPGGQGWNLQAIEA